jgi:hypothetical protein
VSRVGNSASSPGGGRRGPAPPNGVEFSTQGTSLARVSPFWVWMQVLIVIFVIAGIIIGAVKLL